MRAANTLDAFRTAITIPSPVVAARAAESTPSDNAVVRTSALDAGAYAGSQSPFAAALVDRVAELSAARSERARRTLSDPNHPQASDLERTGETTDVHDPSPRAAAVRRDDLLDSRPGAAAPLTAIPRSGLRRLAALSTGSLDEPAPSVEPVTSTQPFARLEEELDRILRAEALSYGIDAEGLGR
jgi:hypothetical protein